MSNFEFLRSVNEHFIDVSTEMDIRDVVPEEGLSKVLDLAFNEVLTKAQQKWRTFKFQIICEGQFKVNHFFLHCLTITSRVFVLQLKYTRKYFIL